jgi:hypothetical protein
VLGFAGLHPTDGRPLFGDDGMLTLRESMAPDIECGNWHRVTIMRHV